MPPQSSIRLPLSPPKRPSRGTTTQATGTLSLSLVDTKSNNRVWLGYGRAQVLVGLSEEERIERLHVILAEMLKTFPPNQRGK